MDRFPCGDATFDVPDDHEARIRQQERIAGRARWRSEGDDAFGDASRTVVGVDQAFDEDEAVSAAVAMRDGEVIERVVARAPLPMPYVPGMLAYREGPATCAALEALDVDADIVLFDGSGRIHYRQAGLATHVGVLRDVRSVGVAKSLLCGRPRRRLDGPLEDGDSVPIEADGEIDAQDGTVLGYAFQSRQYDAPRGRWINPLYVSPGHRIDADGAVAAVAAAVEQHKLPEPIRAADGLVGDRVA